MGGREEEEFVYRISTAPEWEGFQKTCTLFGGELDKSSGFIHLSNLNQVLLKWAVTNKMIHFQVQSTLQNFFLNTKDELFLLQIDAKRLGDGLVYEVVDGTNSFPHFYGPSRSLSPIPLDVVTKAEKITLSDGQFSCSLLA